jgi:catechol 2,3-dioxygenase-like lactoylglutathione lyase family enzyme
MKFVGLLLTAGALFGGPAFAAAAEKAPVQSLLLRSVTVTCKLDASIAFYRDILGQEVIEDAPQDAAKASAFLDVRPTSRVRFVILKGSAVYPGGEIIGGRIAFMGIDDPEAPACKSAPAANHRGRQGDGIHPHRVANIDEIARRARAQGVEILFGPRRSGTGLSRNMMMFDPNGRIVEVFELEFARAAE